MDETSDEYDNYWRDDESSEPSAEYYDCAAKSLREEHIRQERFNEGPRPQGVLGYWHGWEANNFDLESDLEEEAENIRQRENGLWLPVFNHE